MKNILYLASQSPSRKKLLERMGIPFQVFSQSADEQVCDWTLPLEQLVKTIAVHKMESLDLSGLSDKKTIWVVTADTLGADQHGEMYGKPCNFEDAVTKIKKQRDQWARVATSFCLERKSYKESTWYTEKRIVQTVVSQIYFSLQGNEIDGYIQATGAMECAGSITIDGFGAQYLKEIKGSYSCVIGLPLFELRQALHSLCFFLNDRTAI